MTTDAPNAVPAAPAVAATSDGGALSNPWRHLYTLTGIALLVGLLYLIFGFQGYGELTADHYVRGLASPEPRMRWLAVTALSTLLEDDRDHLLAEHPDLGSRLEGLLADPHPLVRATAATGLGALDDPAFAPALGALLAGEAVGSVRLCALGSLIGIAGRRSWPGESRDAVARALDDEDPQVRLLAARTVLLRPELEASRDRALDVVVGTAIGTDLELAEGATALLEQLDGPTRTRAADQLRGHGASHDRLDRVAGGAVPGSEARP